MRDWTARPDKRGLYRSMFPDLGECARVHPAAGDAAPYLTRELYEALHFKPRFHSLMTKDEYDQHYAAAAESLNA